VESPEEFLGASETVPRGEPKVGLHGGGVPAPVSLAKTILFNARKKPPLGKPGGSNPMGFSCSLHFDRGAMTSKVQFESGLIH
jgi:hypothetical protein